MTSETGSKISTVPDTKVRKTKSKENEDSLFDETLDQANVTTDQLNIAIYNSNYKSFRNRLTKDVDKYHKLEVWYSKLISLMGTLTWSTSILSICLTGIDTIMSSIITSSNSMYITQEQFNQSMLITNWIEVSFLESAGLIQIFSNRQSGNVTKHTAHKTKAIEYINILTSDFNKAYSDKVTTSDEMSEMTNLQNQYENEQMQISQSGAYYTSNFSLSPASVSTSALQSVNVVPVTNPTSTVPTTFPLNPIQQQFLNIFNNLGTTVTSTSPSIV